MPVSDMIDPTFMTPFRRAAKPNTHARCGSTPNCSTHRARDHLVRPALNHLDDVEQLWLPHAAGVHAAKDEHYALESAQLFLKFATDVLDHAEKAIAAYGPDFRPMGDG